MQRRTILGLIAGGIVGAGALTTLTWAQNSEEEAPVSGTTTPVSTPEGTAKQITIWRDPGCGCCDAYADYLEGNSYTVTRIDDRNFDKTSISVGVPKEGLGCHLAKIEGYFVSGLVPVEILERLVNEQPEIAGITLPGMPANAPGMARVKSGTLKTYAFGEGGISVYSDE